VRTLGVLAPMEMILAIIAMIVVFFVDGAHGDERRTANQETTNPRTTNPRTTNPRTTTNR
jgi:hypothetical protein